jgi:hypothetical protein
VLLENNLEQQMTRIPRKRGKRNTSQKVGITKTRISGEREMRNCIAKTQLRVEREKRNTMAEKVGITGMNR